jgi:hypothetical protein
MQVIFLIPRQDETSALSTAGARSVRRVAVGINWRGRIEEEKKKKGTFQTALKKKD